MKKDKKEDLRVKRTRKLLSQALLSLIEHHSFNSISVKEICEKAMVHRATFYTHFNDKYDLLAYSLKHIAEEFHFAESNIEEAHLKLFNGVIKYKRLFSQLFLEERDSLRYVIRKEMTNGMKQKAFHDTKTPSISTSSEIGIAAFTGATLGVLNWWIENGMTLSSEEVYNEIKQVLNWNHIEEILNEIIGEE
ncbi:TetR/AcrR family transcriptional regulator [Bacillus subtilis]|uniref:TetR/AcrR family transcriptional regulator n=1 Tax=Bacillus subtilis TaxID=1423 RepID=UPI00119958BB|nr:TetR/AcrR family transcriptional regulator [Bacillus subtilis]MED0587421.1 TetR/AcrR family transcriptional regulator [Bacillus subtilis]TWG67682.1 TetR family transcriptional regulator [Bacillus subtilis J24]TWG73819.1 TetR family transcriptional regulator [Bacillus subtilis J26]